MEKKTALFAATLSLVLAAAPARADDSDIFMSTQIQPNVVILIDTSGSMDDSVVGGRKIDIAKQVVSNLVQTVGGVRYTLFRFNTTSDGALLVTPAGTSVATMVTEIAKLNATGQTPLGRASLDVERYLSGTYTEGGSGTPECNGNVGWYSSHHDGSCTPVTYPSPIQQTCQNNYVIIVTDGMPTGEAENIVADAATSIHTTDHLSTLTGLQTAIVHAIGFDNTSGVTLLTQTATNGGGSFFAAANVTELTNALIAAMTLVMEDNYRFTSPLMPSTSAAGANVAYLASFKPTPKPFWPGSLKAYQRNASGMIDVDANHQPLDSTRLWDAGALLAAKAASTRTIYTELSGSLVSFATSNASITTATLGVTTAAERTDLINYVRGVDTYDEDLDGNVTEERALKLGDIYHSTPVLVFPPPLLGMDASYNTFKTANAGRVKVAFVGANDGMLHAFQASDGQELWAFVPKDQLGTLKNMKPTGMNHYFGVDASPIVTDIKISGTWKTILVFGERRGGRSYHALDITSTTAPTFLWSFTDARMGETWSDPAIGKVKMADGTFKLVAFVSGGYDTGSNNSSGKAVFAIDLATGQKLWQYYNTGSGDAAYMNFSIPATPAAIDLDGDGVLDRVYVGDVGGQLWKFDISPPATLTAGLVNNWTGKRLFNAAPTAQNPPSWGEYYPTQAMYGRPQVSYDPSNRLWVYVGTGDRNHPNRTSQNRLYGIIDNTSMTNGQTLTEASLVDAAATNTAITQGWYVTLATYEKVLSAAEVHLGVVFFTTYTPNTTASCVTQAGTAKLYGLQAQNGDAAINWATGEAITGESPSDRSVTVGGGAPSAPRVVTGDTSDAIVVATSEGEVVATPRPRAAGKQVRYWREVH